MRNDLMEKAKAARAAALAMQDIGSGVKNSALSRMATALEANMEAIVLANDVDMEAGKASGLASPLLKRLLFDESKIRQTVSGIRELERLADPIGETRMARQLAEGLELYRVACPIGVIGIIFESRPDALVQISSLCLKSGNAVLLKGGSEAAHTNRLLADVLADACKGSGVPDGWIGLLESREEVGRLLAMDDLVDLLIPRGSNSFVRYIMDNTHIPVLGHAEGICHTYVDKTADPEMAVRVCVDAKTQYVAVCNATETILVHRGVADRMIPLLADALRKAGVELFGDDEVCTLTGCQPAESWDKEYLDYKVSLRIVDNLEAAVDHVNRHGSGHTDAIITADSDAAAAFMGRVDSGNVFWNCSTRFSDGFKYGFGAEVGVSTSKIHARGPVGLEGLVTYKYKMIGHGDIVAEYADGTRSFTHEELQNDCPL